MGGALIAAVSPSPSPMPFDPAKVEPGFIGLVFFLAMFAAVIALTFSLRSRLRRLETAKLPGGWAAPAPAESEPLLNPQGPSQEYPDLDGGEAAAVRGGSEP